MSRRTISTMRIDRIEASKHKRGRVLVFLEDGSLLKVTEQELLTFGLRAGDTLDEETLRRLKEAAGVSNVKTTAADLIGRRAMSRRDLERKLQERGPRRPRPAMPGNGWRPSARWMTLPMPPRWRTSAVTGATAPGGPGKSCGKRAYLKSCGTRRWRSCRRMAARSTAFCRASSMAAPRRKRKKSG